MSIELYAAPPGTGKTHWAVRQIIEATRGLAQRPIVCVDNALQRRDWQRRLAVAGGALGVQLVTFQSLARMCLASTGNMPETIDDSLQYRLLRSLLNDIDLTYYAGIKNTPGFAIELAGTLGELQRAMVTPEILASAAATVRSPRLVELAVIYRAYADELERLQRLDLSGLTWAAVRALEQEGPSTLYNLVLIDGIGNYDTVQAALLRALSSRVKRMVVLLDDEPADSDGHRIGSPLGEDRALLEQALAVAPRPLPVGRHSTHLCAIRDNLFTTGEIRREQKLELVAAPDTEHEIRTALRWIKARIILDGVGPEETALVLRNPGDSIALIEQTAEEFELPVSIETGRPLEANPCIATLMTLLESAAPLANDTMALRPRELYQVLTSPYFDWEHVGSANGDPIGWAPNDAYTLDGIGRKGIVIEGLTQWREALALACSASAQTNSYHQDSNFCTTVRASEVSARFERIIQRISPPEPGSYSQWVGWLEDLIGDATEDPLEQSSLGMAREIERDKRWAPRDRGALIALKDVLRALVDMERLLGAERQSYRDFLDELSAALKATSYRPEVKGHESAVKVLSASRCGGLSFSAIALVGLAEGEFPQSLHDSVLLPEQERQMLRDQGLDLRKTLFSMEQALLYQIAAAARDRLLATRPRLAPGGAEWAPSPYWEELVRLSDNEPQRLTSSATVDWENCASWDEAIHAASRGRLTWANERLQANLDHIAKTERILSARTAGYRGDRHNGYLAELSDVLQQRYATDRIWSATSLESYTNCPFAYYVGHVLHLEPRQQAQLGPDARQLGSILHRIMERTYNDAMAQDEHPSLELLTACLGKACDLELEDAPQREGFRETAWWCRTRERLEQRLERTICAIEDDSRWAPWSLEARFSGREPIHLEVDGRLYELYLRGFIDRVDRNAQGEVRIIDYKTAGPTNYSARRAEDGELLQIPLYGLATEQVLDLGHVKDGFYWHLLAAKHSPLTISRYDAKHAESAAAVAMRYACQATQSIPIGEFVPRPPQKGCPGYCPAAAFCSQYRNSGGRW